jgi:hypothetical protein
LEPPERATPPNTAGWCGEASGYSPESGEVRWTATDNGVRSHLVKGEGWTLRATRWRGNSADVTVTATSEELASRILKEATRGAKDKEKPVDSVDMGFWHLTQKRGACRDNRRITTPAWADIRRNYSSEVASTFDRLVEVTPATVSGRLLLLHGAPGTGKTTLRAAARRDRPGAGGARPADRLLPATA